MKQQQQNDNSMTTSVHHNNFIKQPEKQNELQQEINKAQFLNKFYNDSKIIRCIKSLQFTRRLKPDKLIIYKKKKEYLINSYNWHTILEMLQNYHLQEIDSYVKQFNSKAIDVEIFTLIFLKVLDYNHRDLPFLVNGIRELFLSLNPSNGKVNYIDFVNKYVNNIINVSQIKNLIIYDDYQEYNYKFRTAKLFDKYPHKKPTQKVIYSKDLHSIFIVDQTEECFRIYDEQLNMIKQVNLDMNKHSIQFTAINNIYYSHKCGQLGVCLQSGALSWWSHFDNYVKEITYQCTTRQTLIVYAESIDQWVTVSVNNQIFKYKDLNHEIEQMKINFFVNNQILQLFELSEAKQLVVATNDGKILFWNLILNYKTYQIDMCDYPTFTLKYDYKIKYLFTSGYTNLITGYCFDQHKNQFTKAIILIAAKDPNIVCTFEIVPDLGLLVSVDNKSLVKIWDLNSQQPVQKIQLESKNQINQIIALHNGYIGIVSNRINLLAVSNFVQRKIVSNFQPIKQIRYNILRSMIYIFSNNIGMVVDLRYGCIVEKFNQKNSNYPNNLQNFFIQKQANKIIYITKDGKVSVLKQLSEQSSAQFINQEFFSQKISDLPIIQSEYDEDNDLLIVVNATQINLYQISIDNQDNKSVKLEIQKFYNYDIQIAQSNGIKLNNNINKDDEEEENNRFAKLIKQINFTQLVYDNYNIQLIKYSQRRNILIVLLKCGLLLFFAYRSLKLQGNLILDRKNIKLSNLEQIINQNQEIILLKSFDLCDSHKCLILLDNNDRIWFVSHDAKFSKFEIKFIFWNKFSLNIVNIKLQQVQTQLMELFKINEWRLINMEKENLSLFILEKYRTKNESFKQAKKKMVNIFGRVLNKQKNSIKFSRAKINFIKLVRKIIALIKKTPYVDPFPDFTNKIQETNNSQNQQDLTERISNNFQLPKSCNTDDEDIQQLNLSLFYNGNPKDFELWNVTSLIRDNFKKMNKIYKYESNTYHNAEATLTMQQLKDLISNNYFTIDAQLNEQCRVSGEQYKHKEKIKKFHFNSIQQSRALDSLIINYENNQLLLLMLEQPPSILIYDLNQPNNQNLKDDDLILLGRITFPQGQQSIWEFNKINHTNRIEQMERVKILVEHLDTQFRVYNIYHKDIHPLDMQSIYKRVKYTLLALNKFQEILISQPDDEDELKLISNKQQQQNLLADIGVTESKIQAAYNLDFFSNYKISSNAQKGNNKRIIDEKQGISSHHYAIKDLSKKFDNIFNQNILSEQQIHDKFIKAKQLIKIQTEQNKKVTKPNINISSLREIKQYIIKQKEKIQINEVKLLKVINYNRIPQTSRSMSPQNKNSNKQQKSKSPQGYLEYYNYNVPNTLQKIIINQDNKQINQLKPKQFQVQNLTQFLKAIESDKKTFQQNFK